MTKLKLSLEDLDIISDYIEEQLELINGKDLKLKDYHTKKIEVPSKVYKKEWY